MYSVVTIISIIISVLIGNILCAEVSNRNNQQKAWGRSNTSNFNYYQRQSSTTPWPDLDRSRNRQNNLATIRTSQWVRPNNGPNWVRNTPSPQNSGYLSGRNEAQNNRGFNSFTNSPNQRYYHNSNVNNAIYSGYAHSGAEDIHMGNQETSSSRDNSVNDDELRQFSEELLNKDINNAAQHVTVNLQGMTSSRSTRDEAPLPLLSINQAAFSMSTIAKLILLYNNYIVEADQNEVYTAQEKNEENDLLSAIVQTPVMQHTRNFLISKGKVGRDPETFKELLRSIWFSMYSRGRRQRVGSSGFEHVFLAELKNNQVSGLHNWIYFGEEENKRNIDYLGYMKKIDLGGKGSILKFHFTFQGFDKPVASMFIGTSPELEMALYSTCFILRADKICPLKMNGKRFTIRTYTYKGKNMIGSAFPEI